MLKKEEITASLRKLGITEGDTVLVHSSFKSFGGVDGGAHTVISAFLDAIGEEGTLVFPTFCQKDWEHVYENWHMDAPSDVGYLTEYFRKLPDARRSNQATHSVAAIGKRRDELTATHGETGKRYGAFGDTPFSADSPWEKMYLENAKVVLIGVTFRCVTFRHYAEYCYVEQALEALKSTAVYEEMKAKVATYGKPGIWPSLANGIFFSDNLKENLRKMGVLYEAKCGEAVLTCFPCAAFVDECFRAFCEHDPEITDTESEKAEWFYKAESLGFRFCNKKR